MSTIFHRPSTIEDAVSILSADGGARPLAGGQTLVAMMNGGLLEPTALVSLRAIAALRIFEVGAAGTRIGAMVSHCDVERDARLIRGLAVVREAASHIAHPAIRSFGTMGGAVSHADPNADYPPALVAADASMVASGPSGRRSIPAQEFFLDYLTSALEPGEILTEIVLPSGLSDAGAVGVYEKFARVDGDYATVSVAAVLTMNEGTCKSARIAIGSCGPTPLRSDESDAALVGTSLDDASVAKAGAILAASADPVDDVRGSADLRRKVIPRLLRRALDRAIAKSKA